MFDYPLSKRLCDNFKLFICCGYTCCCLKTSRYREKYEQAQQKMYNELDIVNVVRALRNAKFLTSLKIEPYQRNIMHFNEEYCVGDPKGESESFSDDDVL